MQNTRKCLCNGVNEYCITCDGTGYIPLPGYEKIQVDVDPLELVKENIDLKKYNQAGWEEVEMERRPKIYRKKKKGNLPTLVSIPDDDYLNYVGPKNPNRKKLGDTRLLSVNKVLNGRKE